MWRGNPEIDELKDENRRAMQEHKAATNFFDVLSIVEHPKFRKFYEDLNVEDGIDMFIDGGDDEPKTKGDLETVGLKENYEEYDFRLPFIVDESAMQMKKIKIDINKLAPFGVPYESLIKMVPDRETWIDKNVENGVNAGFYEVTTGVFRSSSYNDYIGRLTNHIVEKLNSPVDKIGRNKNAAAYPGLMVDNVEIAGAIDRYIRHRLFNMDINPAEGKNWKVLLFDEVMNHIKGQLVTQIIKAQEEVETVGETKVVFTAFSSVDKITVREKYCIQPVKCIYEKCPYPSNKGIFERDFMVFCDRDGEVDAFCKVIENRHTFARFRYIRDDGMPAEYIPDFVVRMGNDCYLVETKAQNQLSQPNVVRKKRAAVRWVEKINMLKPETRENITWHYAMLPDKMFYDWRKRNASVRDMLEYSELKNTDAGESGRLF
jgi:type III restriction enzyme